MLSFIYNGVKSTDLGIMVNKINHHDILSKKRIETNVIKRIDGTLYNDMGTFESYVLELECTLFNNFTLEDISRVKSLFNNRDGELIINNKPNHILNATLISSVEFSRLFGKTGTFILTFEVDPMSYLKSGQDWITVSNGSTINNIGNYKSSPIYKITGSGNCTLTINGVTMKFLNVTDTFFVNVEIEDLYGEKGQNYNKFMDIDSDFIGLSVGQNLITYSGITKLEIQPRWVDV